MVVKHGGGSSGGDSGSGCGRAGGRGGMSGGGSCSSAGTGLAIEGTGVVAGVFVEKSLRRWQW